MVLLQIDVSHSRGLQREWECSLVSGCGGVSGVLVDVFATGGEEAEDRDVDVADGGDDEGVLNSDAVGEVAFGEREDGATDDGLNHEA